MSATWMRQKLAKLKVQTIEAGKAEHGKTPVAKYKTSRPSKRHPVLHAPSTKAELLLVAQGATCKVTKCKAGAAFYAASTFRKGSKVCTRGTWGRV